MIVYFRIFYIYILWTNDTVGYCIICDQLNNGSTPTVYVGTNVLLDTTLPPFTKTLQCNYPQQSQQRRSSTNGSSINGRRVKDNRQRLSMLTGYVDSNSRDQEDMWSYRSPWTTPREVETTKPCLLYYMRCIQSSIWVAYLGFRWLFQLE